MTDYFVFLLLQRMDLVPTMKGGWECGWKDYNKDHFKTVEQVLSKMGRLDGNLYHLRILYVPASCISMLSVWLCITKFHNGFTRTFCTCVYFLSPVILVLPMYNVVKEMQYCLPVIYVL